jgi:hypothetical protein
MTFDFKDPANSVEMTFSKILIWQEIFTASLFWTGFKSKKPKFYKSITFKQRMFNTPRFCLLEFKITSNLEKYISGFIHA